MLGTYKNEGQPVQLVNAFEEPVRGCGIVGLSVKKLMEHHQQLKQTWGIETTAEVTIPEASLATLIETLAHHVE